MFRNSESDDRRASVYGGIFGASTTCGGLGGLISGELSVLAGASESASIAVTVGTGMGCMLLTACCVGFFALRRNSENDSFVVENENTPLTRP